MNPESRRRSTRDRPAKAPLSEVAIVDVALAILKSDGLDAVSMRRVAAALDTGAGSLYVYFASRDALLRAMQDRIMAGIELEAPDPAGWRAQLHGLLARVHRALVAHPGIAVTALTEPLTSEAALLYLENLLGILLAAGLDRQAAAWAADIFSALVTNAAIEDDVRRVERHELGETLHTLFTGLPADRFPLITANADQIVAGDSDERFRFAIDVVIDGLLARAPSSH
jgi:AcrR family transcriptional regulator